MVSWPGRAGQKWITHLFVLLSVCFVFCFCSAPNRRLFCYLYLFCSQQTSRCTPMWWTRRPRTTGRAKTTMFGLRFSQGSRRWSRTSKSSSCAKILGTSACSGEVSCPHVTTSGSLIQVCLLVASNNLKVTPWKQIFCGNFFNFLNVHCPANELLPSAQLGSGRTFGTVSFSSWTMSLMIGLFFFSPKLWSGDVAVKANSSKIRVEEREVCFFDWTSNLKHVKLNRTSRRTRSLLLWLNVKLETRKTE